MDVITKRILSRWGVVIAVAGGVLLGFLVWTGGSAGNFRMPNHSMAPTIGKGDRVAVDLAAYAESEPEAGDLALFRPGETGDVRWVFRIAAIPGDIVGYDEGRLTRNGRAVFAPEPFQDLTFAAPDRMKAGAEITYPHQLGPTEYFLLSDDPAHMHDSRYWGLVGRAQILGRVTSHE